MSSKTSKAVFAREATGLVREISTFDAATINIIIQYLPVGAIGLLVLPYTVPGSSIVGSVIIAGIASFWLAIVYWLFNVSMPRSGGDYIYVSRVLTAPLGLASNFSITLWSIFVIALDLSFVSGVAVSGFLTTLGTIYGNSGLLGLGSFFSSANGLFAFTTIINVIMAVLVATGLRQTLWTNRVLGVIGIIGTVIGIIVLDVSTNGQFASAFSKYGDYNAVINAANSSGAFPMVNNWNQMTPSLVGAAFAATSLAYLGYSTYVGGEIRNVKKTAPIALVGAFIVVAILFLLMAYGIQNAFGSQFLGAIYALYYASSSSYPLGSVAPSYLFFSSILVSGIPPLLYVIGMGFIIWSIIMIPLFYLTLSRNVMAWSFDRVLPETLSKVSDRFHSPTNAIILIFVISELLLVPVAYTSTFVAWFAASTAGQLIAFFMASVAAIVFPYRRKRLYESSGIQGYKIGSIPLITLAGIISSVFFGILLIAIFTNPGFFVYVPGNLPVTLINYVLAFSFFIVGYVVFYVARRFRLREGIDLGMLLSEIPPE